MIMIHCALFATVALAACVSALPIETHTIVQRSLQKRAPSDGHASFEVTPPASRSSSPWQESPVPGSSATTWTTTPPLGGGLQVREIPEYVELIRNVIREKYWEPERRRQELETQMQAYADQLHHLNTHPFSDLSGYRELCTRRENMLYEKGFRKKPFRDEILEVLDVIHKKEGLSMEAIFNAANYYSEIKSRGPSATTTTIPPELLPELLPEYLSGLPGYVDLMNAIQVKWLCQKLKTQLQAYAHQLHQFKVYRPSLIAFDDFCKKANAMRGEGYGGMINKVLDGIHKKEGLALDVLYRAAKGSKQWPPWPPRGMRQS